MDDGGQHAVKYEQFGVISKRYSELIIICQFLLCTLQEKANQIL